MMKRFANLLTQDMKVTVRSGYLYVVIFLAVIYASIMLFAIPQELKVGAMEYILDETGGQYAEILKEINPSHIISSKAELEKLLAEEPTSLGIILGGTRQKPQLTIMHQGTENPKNLRLLEASFNEALRVQNNEAALSNHKVIRLRETVEKPPFNKSLLPLFAATEVIMFGFIIVAVMVFQEKKEGTLKAYRVTPGNVYEYIASKALVNIFMAVVFGFILTVAVMGLKLDFIPLLTIFVLGSTLVTLLGLWISAYFRDLESFIFVALGAMMVFGLPVVSYFFPAFYLRFFDFIPSYSLMFVVREVLFPTGKTGFLLPTLSLLLVEILAVGFFASRAVRKRLLKEGW